MDLLFTRYASPFFVDYCVENGRLGEFFDNLISKTNEDKLWQMYLSTLPYNDKDFESWKQEVTRQNTATKKQIKLMNKKDIDATVKKSEEILRGYKPPQK